jgi:hypothetical protein
MEVDGGPSGACCQFESNAGENRRNGFRDFKRKGEFFFSKSYSKKEVVNFIGRREHCDRDDLRS